MARRTYTDEHLTHAVRASRSWRGVLRELGLAATSAASIRSVKQHSRELGLDHSHFTGQRRWTEDEFATAVAAATTWSQVTAALGLAGGSSTAALKGHAARLGLDVSHLGRRTGQPSTFASTSPSLTHLPRSGSLLAAGWFSMCGYDVSWPLEPCRYDLLACRGSEVSRIQVKTTRVGRPGAWVVALSTTGRPHRHAYDPDDVDYFFIVDGELQYYLLPVAAGGGLHGVSLASYQHFKVPQTLTEDVTEPPGPS